jgi:hypothetical protein
LKVSVVYSSRKKQFIFKQTSGKVWSFFQDERQGLCYSTLTKRNSWSEPVIIQRDLSHTFYIDMDFEDCFHILFQEKQGNIFYTLIDNGNINTIPVLNSKSPSMYDKYLNLIPVKKNIHIFFIINHNNEAILAHQTLTAGKVSAPKVIDYVYRNDYPYSVVCDKSGNVYLFYQVSDGKYSQLGFKKYITLQKNWGEFTPVTMFNGNCEFPRTVIDSNDIIHICYQRQTDKQYELVYQQKLPDRNLWTGETVIHSSQYPFIDSSVVLINNKIIVYWVRDDIIYFSTSGDNSVSWSRPARYNFVTGRQLVNIKYKSNHPLENEKVIVKDIPGNFINGFRLAFYQDLPNINSLSADDLKNILLEGFKTLKGNVEELEESNMALKESITNLEAAQQNLNKELVKYSVRVSFLENELNRLKNMSGRFDALNGATESPKPKVKLKTAELMAMESKMTETKPMKTKATEINPIDTGADDRLLKAENFPAEASIDNNE